MLTFLLLTYTSLLVYWTSPMGDWMATLYNWQQERSCCRKNQVNSWLFGTMSPTDQRRRRWWVKPTKLCLCYRGSFHNHFGSSLYYYSSCHSSFTQKRATPTPAPVVWNICAQCLCDNVKDVEYTKQQFNLHFKDRVYDCPNDMIGNTHSRTTTFLHMYKVIV